jgi:hypothetical protein
MNCIKRLGERVMSRTFERQVNELHIRAAILNRLTELGRPQTAGVWGNSPQTGLMQQRLKLSGVNPVTGLPAQMTDTWVRNAVARLENSENDAAKETAKIIIDAYDRGNLIKTITGVRSDGVNLVKIP